MHRFYHPKNIPENEVISLDSFASHHLQKALRLKEGDNVELFNGDGFNYCCQITNISKNNTEVFCHKRNPNMNESSLNIIIAQAMTSNEKLDFIMQKNTELGVNTFYLFEATRSTNKINNEKIIKKIEHFQKIIISACEQCGRSTIPKLEVFKDFRSLVIKLQEENHENIILDTNPKDSQNLRQLFMEPKLNKSFSFLIGPEGGFTAEEIILATKANIKSVNLGKRILRTETASIAIVSAIHSLIGDFCI